MKENSIIKYEGIIFHIYERKKNMKKAKQIIHREYKMRDMNRKKK